MGKEGLELGFNPELNGEDVSKEGLNEAFSDVLSIEQDPYSFLKNFLNRYYSPTTLRKDLQKIGGKSGLEDMLLDPHIDSAIQKRKKSIRQAKVRFVSEDPKQVDFVESVITRPLIQDVLKGLWEAWFYGYTVDELIYRKENGLIVLDRLRKMPFHWFTPHTDLKNVFYVGGYLKEKGGEWGDRVPATYGKYLLNVHEGSFEKPYGRGLAFAIFFISKFKEMGWGFWGDWLQKYASGFITAEVSRSQASDERALRETKDKLAKAIRGAAIVYTEGNKVDVQWPQSTGEQFKVFRDAAIDDIFMAILGETLTSRASENGARAAAEVHMGVQQDKIDLDMHLTEQALDRLIEYHYTLNNLDKSNMPYSEVTTERGLQKERADRDAVLAGIVPKKFSTQYFINNYGFREEDFSEEDNYPQGFLSDKEESATLADHSLVGETKETFESESKLLEEKEESLDDLIDYLARNTESIIEADDIFAAIEASETKKQLQENLESFLFADSTKFEETLTKALFYKFAEGMGSARD